MKIAIVDPGNFSPQYDANLCHCLAARGHDLTLSTSEFLFEPVPPLEGYTVENDFFRHLARVGPAEGVEDPAASPEGRRLPDRHGSLGLEGGERPTPTWSTHSGHYFRSWTRGSTRDCDATEYPSSNTAHDIEPFRGSTWSRAGFSGLYRLADAVIVHAEEGRRRLVDDHGVVPSRVHVVPIGLGEYAAKPLPRAEARRRLALEPDVPYLLFFGLIKEHKGLDVLLEALAVAREERPDLRLLSPAS